MDVRLENLINLILRAWNRIRSLTLMYDLVHRARSKHHPRLWAFDFFHIGTRDIFQSGFALKIGLSRKVFSSHANDPFFVSQLAIRACSWFRFQIWHSYPKWTFVTLIKKSPTFFLYLTPKLTNELMIFFFQKCKSLQNLST